MKSSRCASCGIELDAARSLEVKTHGPRPGDISICIYCSYIMVYADDLALRELTDKEMIEIAGEPELLKAVAITKAFREWKDSGE